MPGHRHSYGKRPEDAWTGKPQRPAQQYLRPEDVYNMDSGSSHYASSIRSQSDSRHSSESQSPNTNPVASSSRQGQVWLADAVSMPSHRHPSPASRAELLQQRSQSPRDARDAISTDLRSRKASSADSRHAENRPGQGIRRHHTDMSDEKGKSPARKEDRHAESTSRHGRGSDAEGKPRGSVLPRNNLVHGVFIRY
jgi:hypothetical protein